MTSSHRPAANRLKQRFAEGLSCIRLLEKGPDMADRNTIRFKPMRMISGRLTRFGYDLLGDA